MSSILPRASEGGNDRYQPSPLDQSPAPSSSPSRASGSSNSNGVGGRIAAGMGRVGNWFSSKVTNRSSKSAAAAQPSLSSQWAEMEEEQSARDAARRGGYQYRPTDPDDEFVLVDVAAKPEDHARHEEHLRRLAAIADGKEPTNNNDNNGTGNGESKDVSAVRSSGIHIVSAQEHVVLPPEDTNHAAMPPMVMPQVTSVNVTPVAPVSSMVGAGMSIGDDGEVSASSPATRHRTLSSASIAAPKPSSAPTAAAAPTTVSIITDAAASQAALVNSILATYNDPSLLRSLLVTGTAPPIQPKALFLNCSHAQCLARFTFYRRRHHCRLCSLIFCDNCLPYRRFLPFNSSPTPTPAPSSAATPNGNSSNVAPVVASDNNTPQPVCFRCTHSILTPWRQQVRAEEEKRKAQTILAAQAATAQAQHAAAIASSAVAAMIQSSPEKKRPKPPSTPPSASTATTVSVPSLAAAITVPLIAPSYESVYNSSSTDTPGSSVTASSTANTDAEEAELDRRESEAREARRVEEQRRVQQRVAAEEQTRAEQAEWVRREEEARAMVWRVLQQQQQADDTNNDEPGAPVAVAATASTTASLSSSSSSSS